MDATIALYLAQDGLINGAIYALVGVAMVMVFTLTRVIMVFLGEFLAFSAMTYMALQRDGAAPAIIWVLVAAGVAATAVALWRGRGRLSGKAQAGLMLTGLVYPAIVAGLIWALAPVALPTWVDGLLALALVVPLAGYTYRLVFEPIGNASILVLLITAVGVHMVLMGIGLLAFGPEGTRGPAMFGGSLDLGALRFSGQQTGVVAVAVLALLALFAFFERSYLGMALRATAVNRLGAQLVGIPTALSGTVAFCIAAAIVGICGILVAPLTTIFYDTGFVIALKGFVVAVLGGLVSYPLTMAAALFLGLVEAFSSFHWSQYKDVITYGLILPALLLRSFTSHQEHEE